MKKLHVILVSALCLAAFVSACGSGTHETDGQLTGVITFVTGSASLNGKTVTSGTKVRAGDKIETRENSSAVIQFDDGSLVILREQTSIDIQTIPARSIKNGKENGIGLIQRKGTTFNKTSAHGTLYSAKERAKVTSSGDAAYSFTVKSQSDETAVSLLRGKVNVLPDSGKSADSITLDTREKVTSSANNTINRKAGLSKTETRELTALDTIRIIPAAKLRKGTYSPQDVVPDEVLPLLLDKDQVRATSSSDGKPVNARTAGTKHAETNAKSSARVTDRTSDSKTADNKSASTNNRDAVKDGKSAQSNSSASTSTDGKNAATRSSAKGEARESATADGKQKAVTRDTKSAQSDTSVKSPSARKGSSVSNDTKSASRPAKESGTAKSRSAQSADRKVTDADSGVKSTSARVSISYLEKKYGKLSRVFTIDGKEYVGVFRQTGNTIEIITTDGTVTIPTSAVKKISPYNI